MSNHENMLKWAEELENTRKPQAMGRLRSAAGYCCLGIACELAIRHGVPLHVRVDEGTYAYDNKSTYLPSAVRNWLGITAPEWPGNVRLPCGNHRTNASNLNDDDEATFPEIALAVRQRVAMEQAGTWVE